MSAPPRLPVRWLERCLHPDERQELIGDLSEQFQARVQSHGAHSARRWFWRQTIVLLWGFALRRRDVISHDHERTRGRWLLQNAASDWRYAWRSLVSARGASLVALLTLTLSLGLSTAVFSIANGLLLRPLPYPDADRLVRLAEAQVARGPQATSQGAVLPESGGTLTDMAAGQFIQWAKTLQHVTPYTTGGRVLALPAGAEQRAYAQVGTGFFDLVGGVPRRGRLFIEADGRREATPSIVLSERLWRDHFQSRDDVVGALVMVDQTPHQVLGVVAGDIRFPEPGIDFWIAGQWRWPTPGVRRSLSTSMAVVARLAPGQTVEAAQAEARQIGVGIAASDPAFAEGGDVAVPEFRVRSLQEDLVHPVRPALMALSAGMALVLLVAAANLVNVLLARSTARQREMAVRLTLGAGRWRIVRPLLFEQLLLAGLGAVTGIALAWVLLRVTPLLAPETLAQLVDVRFDAWSLLFVATMALTLGVVVGLLPAWQLPAANLRDLSTAGRAIVGTRAVSAESVRRGLVVVQVALAVVLLVGAALLGRTMWALTHVHPGFVPNKVLTFKVALPALIFQQPERQSAFFDDVLTRLRQHPDVRAAGATSTLPLGLVGLSGSFYIEGTPRPTTAAEWPRANKVSITPGYLEAVGTRVVRGRGLTEQDSASAEPVVLVDEALARQYFNGREAIGQRIEYFREFRRIVGVTESIKQRDVTADAEPVIYIPATQLPAVAAFNALTGGVAVRTTGNPRGLQAFVRTVVSEVDPTIPVHAMAPLSERLGDTFATPRFYAYALGLFASLALVVAVLGVYGVLAYAVERRQVEFGVRRALGGDERHILGLVLRQASVLVVLGIAAGVTIAALGAGLLRTLLFGVTESDIPTYAAAAFGLWLVGLAAAWLPAWRAMRVDPARVLRAE